ncbi:methionyl-tRNA formyltransferase [Hymenobacter setariae]|uniref:Methionyl-tRNA formyltransferase n=1 Tax=Hymenobacter setariae TaxID=2594794 RepID=A0A558C398_9BACT|nr:methionyl-tRNA formyltransferase [Hymenobacter setariae]TVT43253.1 methionyl-tRNA formyltransferase [Hymenobacter setariae]
MSTPLRLIFMGTPDFAVPTLETLLALPEARVVAVVTGPDRPAGRGRQLQASAVKQAALAHSLPVLQPTNLKDSGFQEELRSYAADLQVVVAFRMLPEAVWNMPRLGSVNIHGSLLPQYRGAAPINWALMHGDQETGVTSFFLRHEIDTGDLILQEKLAITPDDDFGSVYDKLKVLGAQLAARTVAAIAAGTAPSTPQPTAPDGLRPAPKLTKETGRLDFSRSAAELVNQIRGLSPAPAAYTALPDGRSLKVFRAEAVDAASDTQAGTWSTDGRQSLGVTTSNGWLKLLEVQLEGKKRMSVEEFLRGTKLTF